MEKFEMKRVAIYLSIFVVLVTAIYSIIRPTYNQGRVSIQVQSEKADTLQLFYVHSAEETWTEENSVIQKLGVGMQTIDLFVETGFYQLRLDLGNDASNKVKIVKIALYDGNKFCTWKGSELYELMQGHKIEVNQIKVSGLDGDIVELEFEDGDPYMILKLMNYQTISEFYLKYILIAISIALLLTIVVYKFIYLRDAVQLCKKVFVERKMLMSLAMNDFKVKYAGSYFGTIWAFVQPICTIMLFWFVFQMGLKSTPVSETPFALWLSAGLVPWFFFSEGWGAATNAFVEYSYLVKKVVFKIEILPLVKIGSSLFVHVFFILFVMMLFCVNGIYPNANTLWIIYYMFALCCLTVALSYITSCIVVFFKDMSQIMGIILQFGMWLTPIMWSLDVLPAKFVKLFKLNPMFYIVSGYRYSMIGDMAFMPSVNMAIYFWLVTIFLFLGGISLFARLKDHFADVL